MLLTLSSRVVQFIIMFLTVRVMTTVLSPDEYGKVAIITAITAFFAFFFINPVGTYINRHLNEWNKTSSLGHVFKQYLVYLLLVSNFAFAIVFFVDGFGIYSLPDGATLALLVAITLFFATANQTLIPSLNILGKTTAFSWLTMGTAAGTLTGAVLATQLLHTNAFTWLAGVVFGQALLAVAAWLYLSRNSTLGWSNQPPYQHKTRLIGKPVFSFGLPVALSAGFIWLHLHGYRLVLGELVSLTELGLFAAGYTLAIQVVAAVELILNTWFQPVFYKDCDSESSAVQSSAWSKYACNIWLPAALAVSALVSGAPFFVRFMLGDGYQNTVHYVQLGALVEFGRILVGVSGLYFHQHKQTNKLILPSAAGAVVALLLVLLWVPQYGVSSTLPALFVGCLLSFGWLLFLIPKSSRPSLRAWMNLLKGVLLALFLLIICMVFQIQLADYWLWVWTVLWTVVGVIYLKMRIQ